MIVVIEGMDASGKATQSKLLAERLNGTRFSFPNYESETGKAILAHLKKEWVAASTGRDATGQMDHIDPLVFQSLQAANRLELLPEIQRIASGRDGTGHIVFDRYWQSAYVYGSLDGLDKEWLQRVQRDPMPQADVNILIDVPVEEGFTRRPDRRDRYEANREFLEKVRVEYLRLWGLPMAMATNVRSFTHRPGWYVVNGLGTVEEVRDRIVSVVV